VTVARPEENLKLGKGTAFVKAHLKRLRQADDTWEAYFRALPKPMRRTETHYLGMVVTQPDGIFLADSHVEGRPTVNDLATLLAHAMCGPLTEGAHRPARLSLRGHRQWQPLLPHLKELNIEVSVQLELPTFNRVFERCFRDMEKTRSRGNFKPTAEQAAVEQKFPAIAQWVRGYGHIEIGDQEMFGFVVRAMDYGGVVLEDDKPATLAEAMAALEKGLAEYFEREGIELP
jgi:hypothetical protein